MEFKKEQLIKSPLNYTGGKFKLLPQILPLLPDDIGTFVDLFCGGGNVGVNIRAEKIICNDIEPHIISLLRYFKNSTSREILSGVEAIIARYGLSDTRTYGYGYYGCNSSDGVASYNKDPYLRLRADYNKDTSNDLMFFAVVLFAFSNQIRFNSKGEFNMPVNKRDFNDVVRQNTVRFIDKLRTLDVGFICGSFEQFSLDAMTPKDLIYCDPPYLVTCASYNEQSGWTEAHERRLLAYLDEADKRGIRFALSNVFENKGKSNDILIEWSKRYTVHHLNHTYANCNYHAKNKSTSGTDEVLIVNFRSGVVQG